MTVNLEAEPLPLERIGWALSGGLAVFSMWGWTEAAGIWSGEAVPSAPGLLLLGFIAVVMQFATNYAAAAARRSGTLKLTGSRAMSFSLLAAGAAYSAYSIHHAWEMTGLIAPFLGLSLNWFVASFWILLLSIVLAVFEPGLYWLHESLTSEVAGRRQEREAEADRARHKREAEAEALRLKREAASREAGADHEARPHGLTRRLAVAASGLSLIASPAVASESLTIEPQGRVSTLEATRPKPYDASIVQGWLEARAASPGLTQIAYAETAGIARATLQRHLKRWCDAGQPQLAG